MAVKSAVLVPLGQRAEEVANSLQTLEAARKQVPTLPTDTLVVTYTRLKPCFDLVKKFMDAVRDELVGDKKGGKKLDKPQGRAVTEGVQDAVSGHYYLEVEGPDSPAAVQVRRSVRATLNVETAMALLESRGLTAEACDVVMTPSESKIDALLKRGKLTPEDIAQMFDEKEVWSLYVDGQ